MSAPKVKLSPKEIRSHQLRILARNRRISTHRPVMITVVIDQETKQPIIALENRNLLQKFFDDNIYDKPVEIIDIPMRF